MSVLNVSIRSPLYVSSIIVNDNLSPYNALATHGYEREVKNFDVKSG